MKKRIIVIGSLIAAALIVLVSFNSVVSIQTLKSDSKTVASPLFSIRTRRAIKEESKDALTCNYVGKDKGVMIPFPTRDSRTVLLQKIIDSISKMDDKSFDRFVKIVIANINQNNKINSVEVSDEEIAVMLYQLRADSEAVKNNYMVIKESDPPLITFDSKLCLLLLLIFVLIAQPFILLIALINQLIRNSRIFSNILV